MSENIVSKSVFFSNIDLISGNLDNSALALGR